MASLSIYERFVLGIQAAQAVSSIILIGLTAGYLDNVWRPPAELVQFLIFSSVWTFVGVAYFAFPFSFGLKAAREERAMCNGWVVGLWIGSGARKNIHVQLAFETVTAIFWLAGCITAGVGLSWNDLGGAITVFSSLECSLFFMTAAFTAVRVIRGRLGHIRLPDNEAPAAAPSPPMAPRISDVSQTDGCSSPLLGGLGPGA
ncbi:hypothetical protein ANO11243_092270 [Dothideomycetidae sp. 11243]|nr:hypothetical protein ANO11243_092270 [fungal sp. No.11243]